MGQMHPRFLVEQDSSATPANLHLLDEGQVISGWLVGDAEMAGDQVLFRGWIGATFGCNEEPVNLSDVVKTLHTGFPHDRFSSIP
jgi:hypothetical protein